MHVFSLLFNRIFCAFIKKSNIWLTLDLAHKLRAYIGGFFYRILFYVRTVPVDIVNIIYFLLCM